MKKILLTIAVTLLTVATSSAQMADRKIQELTIDVNQEINQAELTIIIDDIYYETYSYSYSGSQVIMYLAEGVDYHLIINREEYFNFTLLNEEIIDDRDISISTDMPYRFSGGVLIFGEYGCSDR